LDGSDLGSLPSSTQRHSHLPPLLDSVTEVQAKGCHCFFPGIEQQEPFTSMKRKSGHVTASDIKQNKPAIKQTGGLVGEYRQDQRLQLSLQREFFTASQLCHRCSTKWPQPTVFQRYQRNFHFRKITE